MLAATPIIQILGGEYLNLIIPQIFCNLDAPAPRAPVEHAAMGSYLVVSGNLSAFLQLDIGS